MERTPKGAGKDDLDIFVANKKGRLQGGIQEISHQMGKETHLPNWRLDMLVPQQGRPGRFVGPQELDEGEELDEEERKALGGLSEHR